MTINSEITRINGNIASAYTAAEAKGATLPVTQNSDNLGTCIASISGGGNFIGIPREVSQQGVYQVPTTSFTFSLPSNATSIGIGGLTAAFQNCTGLTSADLSTITSIREVGLQYAFSGCTNLTSINLSALTSINGYGLERAFSDCTSLTSINLSVLTSIDSYGLTYAFSGCENLTDIYFGGLTTTSFGSSTDQFQYMMDYTNPFGIYTIHTLHFPNNIETTIQELDDYPTFGGDSDYIVLAFDLPATS